ncbi:MAG: hypothetical protein IPO88_17720 [Nannocystis sp.]|uniref:hypothetical protein n=1 Tax=Nannocystis sp. TaxID=1962667 RepID=UPI002429C77C|nr:hypothetical protein [Nannocystis sp.]MBK9755305.1 hypothetical protein [Nannocystis sp.]
MPRVSRPSLARRCLTASLCTSLAVVVAVAPAQAQASEPALHGATMSTGMSPTAAKLRTIMSLHLQDPDAPDDVAPAGDAPTAQGPVAQGAPIGPAPAPAPSTPPPRKGLGMMIAGAAITGAYALPLVGFGAYTIILSNRYDEVTGGGTQGLGAVAGGVLVAFGVIGLGVGVPLLGVGAYRFSKYLEWKKTNQVSLRPSMSRTMHGTYTTGVTLRF